MPISQSAVCVEFEVSVTNLTGLEQGLDVAVVGMPDPVLVERACAYVVLNQDKVLLLMKWFAFERETNHFL
jgi:non-ribosomal peptide synthetase component E (peptide arylation enzyme)